MARGAKLLLLSGPACLIEGTAAIVVLTCALLSAVGIAMAAQPAANATPGRASKHNNPAMVEQAPPPKQLDYDKLTQEASQLLSSYVQIDTTNPPGNELPAAKFLREKFLDDGIPATIWEPKPGRGVIAARLHGSGRHTKALVLLSHMDVVPADAAEWKVPPFSGAIKDGSVWGRGALDDKGPGVIELMAMLAIKRAGILLNRDIVFLATGDEETGGKNGAGWVVNHAASVFSDAGYVLNEGGAISTLPDGRRYYAVSVTEKTPLWLKLTSEGPAGHAAVPPQATAVTRLIRALDRLLAYTPPIRVIDPVHNYYQTIGQLEGGPPEYSDIAKALRNDPEFAKKFLSVPRNDAMVRDTITPTILSGSDKTNVIPATAEAQLDTRLLPGDDPKAVEGNIVKALDDKNIKVNVLLNFPSASSPRSSRLMTAISKLAQSDDAQVVPTMIAGFTDSHYFREKGLVAYGFIPIQLTAPEEHTVHGINEHMPIKQLGAGIRRMVQLLEYMGDH